MSKGQRHMSTAEYALVVAILALLVSLGSLGVSFWNVYRDRAKLHITASMAIYSLGGLSKERYPALAIEVINVGRRPITITSAVGLLLEGNDGMFVALTDFSRYHNRPADGTLTEAKGFSVMVPHAEWKEYLAGGGQRCTGIHVKDSKGKIYNKKLSPKIAEWFNGDKPEGKETIKAKLARRVKQVLPARSR